MNLLGKVAMVTGASRGIGKACALALAEAGADLVIGSRNLEPLQAVAKEIEVLGRRALAVGLDVSSAESV
jgi:NAD(P)-dependent dehydrogenase (short-subunit alcohol dehydrogenase family)